MRRAEGSRGQRLLEKRERGGGRGREGETKDASR
jgi:hypothetical protein